LYLRSIAKSSRPVSASREPDSGCVLCVTPDDDRSPPRPAVGPDLKRDAVLEPRVQVAVEEVHRLHDVHVAIDEPQAVLHRVLPGVT